MRDYDIGSLLHSIVLNNGLLMEDGGRTTYLLRNGLQMSDVASDRCGYRCPGTSRFNSSNQLRMTTMRGVAGAVS